MQKCLQWSAVLALSLLLVPAWVRAEPRVSTEPWHLLTTDLPPFAHTRGDDAPGAMVEMVREMAHRIGQDVDIEYLPWTRAQNLIQHGARRTLILPLTRSPERENLYRWVVPLYSKNFVFFALPRRGHGFLSLDRLRHSRVVILRSSPELAQLKERGFTQIIEAETVEKMAVMFKMNAVSALYGDEIINRSMLHRNGLTETDFEVSPPLETGVMWLGGSKDLSDADIALWQDALAQIRHDKTLDRILSKYHLKRCGT